MYTTKRARCWLSCVLVVILLLLGKPQQAGQAQSASGDFRLAAQVIGGGGESSGGSFSNGGVIGESCVAKHSGGVFVLYSGFLHGESLVQWLYDLYLPVVLRLSQ